MPRLPSFSSPDGSPPPTPDLPVQPCCRWGSTGGRRVPPPGAPRLNFFSLPSWWAPVMASLWAVALLRCGPPRRRHRMPHLHSSSTPSSIAFRMGGQHRWAGEASILMGLTPTSSPCFRNVSERQSEGWWYWVPIVCVVVVLLHVVLLCRNSFLSLHLFFAPFFCSASPCFLILGLPEMHWPGLGSCLKDFNIQIWNSDLKCSVRIF